jgi:hypothetical protein
MKVNPTEPPKIRTVLCAVVAVVGRKIAEQLVPENAVQPVFPIATDDDSNQELGDQPTVPQAFPDALPSLLASPSSVGEHPPFQVPLLQLWQKQVRLLQP